MCLASRPAYSPRGPAPPSPATRGPPRARPLSPPGRRSARARPGATAATTVRSRPEHRPRTHDRHYPAPISGAQLTTFGAHDRELWERGDHPLGRGHLRPENATLGSAGLTLSLPAGTFDGGEVRRRRASGWGCHRAHLCASAAPGSLTAFFLYRHDPSSDSSDELDVELPAGEPHRALLTVWRRGCHEPTGQRIVELPFDPAAALHSYEIVREPGGRVVFTIDDVITFASPCGPAGDLYPMFNAWYPDWLPCSGMSPSGFARVSRYELHSF